jgi:2-C-methyl-D-erythritol 4-phosphate cytidylyltransferase
MLEERKYGNMGLLKRLKKQGGDGDASFYCAAVVPAAGSSTRMNGGNKLFMDLCGMPVIIHSLLALENCPDINEIVIAARQEEIMEIGSLCRDYGLTKVTKVVRGGETRAASVLAGLMELSDKVTHAAIHDAVRPLASPELISVVVRMAAQCGAAAPAVQVKDTIKVCRAGTVVSTPDRSTLFAMQTPQVFEVNTIKGALTKAIQEGLSPTDDCAAAEMLGVFASVADGSYENIKITTMEDLVSVRAILEGRQELENRAWV